jgi:hypothetical protein
MLTSVLILFLTIYAYVCTDPVTFLPVEFKPKKVTVNRLYDVLIVLELVIILIFEISIIKR